MNNRIEYIDMCVCMYVCVYKSISGGGINMENVYSNVLSSM